MANHEAQSHVSLDDLLNGVEQLDAPELERFVSQVLTLRAKRVAPCLTGQESRLLEKINQGLPPGVQQRYDHLTAKRHAEKLAPDEHQELLGLIDRVEQADAERLQALGELAQLRQVSLKALMAELGIRKVHPGDRSDTPRQLLGALSAGTVPRAETT